MMTLLCTELTLLVHCSSVLEFSKGTVLPKAMVSIDYQYWVSSNKSSTEKALSSETYANKGINNDYRYYTSISQY